MSGGCRLANPGAVLSFLDGLAGSDPGYHVVWSSGCCAGMWRVTLLFMRWLGFVAFYVSSLLVLLGMVRSIFCFLALRLLGFLGILTCVSGKEFLRLLFGMLGEPWSLVTLVHGLVFGVDGILISGHLEAIILASPERFGMDFFSALSEEKPFPAIFDEVRMVTGICFGDVLTLFFFISVRALNFLSIGHGWKNLALVPPLAWLAACAYLLWWGFSLG